jgi:hypothetical protein
MDLNKSVEADNNADKISLIADRTKAEESVLSRLEFQINQKLRSIDTHHAHIDSNREEIDYLGKETDALLESM